MPKLHKHFENTLAYRRWVIEQDNKTYGAVNTGLELLQRPNENHVDAARALLNKFGESIEVQQQVWTHNVAGFFPDVPAYLAGDPEHMFTREYIHSDQTPLRVWVGVSVMGWITDQQIIERGVCIAAFALAMIPKRPVIISPFVDLGSRTIEGAIISWDITTEPLVIAELMTSLANPAVTRSLGLHACRLLNPRVTGSIDPDVHHEERCRARLNAQPQDLWLMPDKYPDDSIAWIKEHVAKYAESEW